MKGIDYGGCPTNRAGDARRRSSCATAAKARGVMAGLPYSAKNLAGRALQRTQAALPGGGPRLLSRFVNTGAAAGGALPPTSRKLTDVEKSNLYWELRKIHSKREELYDLAAAVQRNYTIPSKIGRANKELLRILASQVDARPTDTLWGMFQASRRVNKTLRFLAVVASIYVVATPQSATEEK